MVGGADGSEGTCGVGVAVSVRTLQTACICGTGKKFLKERSRTGQSEEDDLLVGPLLGGLVVDGDTARGDLAGLLGPGDVTVCFC